MESRPLTSPHLLVVDDEPDVGEFIAAAAAATGIRCTHTADVKEFQALLGPQVTLVMIDLVMPGTDGIELLRYLAQRGCRAGVILMSGFDKRVLSTAENLGKTLGLEVLGHFEKPIRLAPLEAFLLKHRDARSAAAARRPDDPAVSEEELRQAIADDQFVLHYQPQINIRTGAVFGAEGLVRWLHPERGIIMPGAFIDIADSLGLIGQLDGLVLRKGIADAARFRQDVAFLEISLNASPHSLQDLDMPDKILLLTGKAGLPPSAVTLEITESGLFRELATALDILLRLRVKGVRLSIDDFGTGYAMMEQLRRVPANEIKIDRTFVRDALSDDRANVMARKIVEMGRDLGLRVVAEGVETAEQLAFLQELGCEAAQGYLFCRPKPGAEFQSWVRNNGGRVEV